MAQLLADGTRQISLSKKQYEAISKILNSFYQQTKCGVIMLSDVSGLAVALRGTHNQQQMSLLSSLAAGNYAATAEIARLINEESSFSGQFHEGKDQSIYLKGINDEFFVTVVFGRNTTFGMIRVLIDKILEELSVILEEEEEQATAPESSFATQEANPEQKIQNELEDKSFREELSSRLDSILGK